MTRQFKLYGFIALLFLLCCKKQSSNEVNLKRIDVEGYIDNLAVIKLSQFAKGIKYVPLQIGNYINISTKIKYDFCDSLILVYNTKYCLLYNLNGVFLNSIGMRGNGPGEYQFCLHAEFSNNGSIFLQCSLYDLSEYSLDGTFIRKYENTFKFNEAESGYFDQWVVVNDSLFFAHVPNFNGKEDFKAIVINKQGKIKSSWPNFDKFKRNGSTTYERDAFLYFFSGSLNYKQYFSDTLLQPDSMNCGPSCLRMVAKYYITEFFTPRRSLCRVLFPAPRHFLPGPFSHKKGGLPAKV